MQGSRPVSRLLCPRERGRRPSIWDRRCRRPRAVHQGARPGQPPPAASRPVRPLLDLAPGGVCRADRSPGRWCALTAPFHPCRARLGGAAVCSLWHFPAGHPDWPLASTPPCGGRTFLDPGLPGPRPPGRLPLRGQYASSGRAPTTARRPVPGPRAAYWDEGFGQSLSRSSMFPVLALAFLVVPVAELAVLIAVGSHIGFLNTFALMLALSVTGAWLARREGLGAWRRLQAALVEGRMPTVEAADGAMILLAGALLLTPGFLSDVAGVLLLLPPLRALLRRRLPALLARRMGRRGPGRV